MEGDAIQGPVVTVSGEELVLTLQEIKTEKNLGPLDLPLELIAAGCEIGI